MKCDKCGGESRVVDSRSKKGVTYRRRVCKGCGRVFYTEEVPIGYLEGIEGAEAARKSK